MPRQQHDPTRSLAPQPYQTTAGAQRIARELRALDAAGRVVTLTPLADVLSRRTRDTREAIRNGASRA